MKKKIKETKGQRLSAATVKKDGRDSKKLGTPVGKPHKGKARPKAKGY